MSQYIYVLTGKKMMVQERQNSRRKALQEGRGGVQCPQGAAAAGGAGSPGDRKRETFSSRCSRFLGEVGGKVCS